MANTTTETADKAPEAQPHSPTREDFRKKFFANASELREPVELTWNGVDFEWRRPSIAQIQEVRDRNTDEDRNFILDILISYSYISGTDDLLFDPEDYEELLKSPFTGEFQTIVTKIGGAVSLNVEEKAKN